MDKVLIIGPFEDYGGREIEANLVASSLLNDYSLLVCSTGNMTVNSQVYNSKWKTKTTSLKKQLYKNYHYFKPASIVSFLRNKQKEPVHFYVNNKFNSRFNIKKKEIHQLRKLIDVVDIIFILAHLFTSRTKEIIELASGFNKKIIFRTTGAIERKSSWPDYLNKVNLFIHHSESNARNLHSNLSVKYKVIDQSAIQEEKLLKLPYLKRPIQNFVVIGRFSPEKNILNLISYFKKCSSGNDSLYIVGDGEGRPAIEKELTGCHNVKILGQLSTFEIANLYEKMDCLIIPSLNEAGPLVGIEAMAAARIILSTRVGAMPERLKDTGNNFWFEAKSYDSFKYEFLRMKETELELIESISINNRKIYLQNHSKKEVSSFYSAAVREVVNF